MIVVVCDYIPQQGEELGKVSLLILILVLFLKVSGQVNCAHFGLWEKTQNKANSVSQQL